MPARGCGISALRLERIAHHPEHTVRRTAEEASGKARPAAVRVLPGEQSA
ncbi:hypothetical protein ACIHAR_20045 [Streptomyces sp. NPDC052016]